MVTAQPRQLAQDFGPVRLEPEALLEENARLRARVDLLELHVRKGEERRRALLHIMSDLNETNRRLADQRKAMLHILVDYEQDRRRLARQTERLDNSRRALLHILQDVHRSNQHLENTRKAMIHIMGDLRDTTEEIQRREQELRDKQEQLVQAAKLATLGELTTGVAHELNNPLNNIGLFMGNAIDLMNLGKMDKELLLRELHNAMQQVRKATEIISTCAPSGALPRYATSRSTSTNSPRERCRSCKRNCGCMRSRYISICRRRIRWSWAVPSSSSKCSSTC
jgi:C4-dicarboxylate-specific signal transduction histidine kinase